MQEYIRVLQDSRDDYAALARCFNSFKDSDSWPDGFGGSFIFTPEYFETRMKTRDLSSHLVAIAPDDPAKIVGGCFCSPSQNHPESWYVGFLGVDPAYQGKKLGKALLLRATELVTDRGVPFLTLHTWAGNLKAMPLYKRQGYKWRPNTGAYLENFIPQMLRYPLFQDFFSRGFWYDLFKPEINQLQNAEQDDGMPVYEYLFSADEKNSLRVFVDRSIGSISGFVLQSEDGTLAVKAHRPGLQVFIGVQEIPVTLTIENQRDDQAQVDVELSCGSHLEIKKAEPRTVVVPPGGTENIVYRCRILSGAEEIDLNKHTEEYTSLAIAFQLRFEKKYFPLTVGMASRRPVDLHTQPTFYTVRPETRLDIPIVVTNHLDREEKVVLSVEDGGCISFSEHRKELDLSPYDDTISFSAQISQTGTAADGFTARVKTTSGQTILEKHLPVVLASEDRAVSYRLDERIVLENRRVRLTLYEKPRPENNRLLFKDKVLGSELRGYPIVLGYPFDAEGSEFYTRSLQHAIETTETGIMLLSSVDSTERPGIRIRRRVSLPHTGSIARVEFDVENTSEKPQENLGILIQSWWWGPEMTVRIPLLEGILKHNIKEIQPELGTDPGSLKEGWKAAEYAGGASGCLFDPQRFEKMEVGNPYPNAEVKLGRLLPGETKRTPPIFHVFCSRWEEVRDAWLETFSPSPDTHEIPHPMISDGFRLGLTPREGEPIGSAVLLDASGEPAAAVALDVRRKAGLQGRITLGFRDLPVSPNSMDIPDQEAQRWYSPFSFESSRRRAIVPGELTYDSGSQIYSYPVAAVFYDSSKQIEINGIEEEGQRLDEVRNGSIVFRCSQDFLGTLHYLSTEEEPTENYLYSTFPTPRPFLWVNRFFGGIGATIRRLDTFWNEDFTRLAFERFDVARGKWRGIGYRSEVITYSADLKGIDMAVSYATLPSSALILVTLEVTNHSGAMRYFDGDVTCFHNTSESTGDRFFTSTRRGTHTYRSNDYQAIVETDETTRWVAFAPEARRHITGQLLYPATRQERVGLYAPNLKTKQTHSHYANIRVQPGASVRFHTLFVLARDLSEIPPLAATPLEALLI
jgi:GNAT superfamily N-acetyltransferase